MKIFHNGEVRVENDNNLVLKNQYFKVTINREDIKTEVLESEKENE